MAVRGASEEARRVGGEQGCERRGHRVRELVLLDPVPYAEHEEAAGAEHATRLRKRLCLVGKNMTPNWQTTASNAPSSNGSRMASAWRHSIGRCPHRDSLVEHGLIQVRGHDRDALGQHRARTRVTTPVPAAISSIGSRAFPPAGFPGPPHRARRSADQMRLIDLRQWAKKALVGCRDAHGIVTPSITEQKGGVYGRVFLLPG